MRCLSRVRNGFRSMVSNIVNKIDKRNLKKIFEEIQKNNLAYIRMLVLRKDQGLNAKGEEEMTAILTAAKFKKIDILKWARNGRLLIDVDWVLKDQRNVYGDNLLLVATFNNDLSIVRYLVGRAAGGD